MNISRKLSWLLVALVIASFLFILSATSVFADNGEVIISPQRDDTVTLHPGQTAKIRWGWVNCNRGLANAWISATEQNFILMTGEDALFDINSDEAANYWGQPLAGAYDERCFWPTGTTWTARWEYELPALEPGEYALHVFMATTHPLTDGFDANPEDGQLDFYGANTWFDKTITITVLDP
jgi:hypothetical protein